MLQTGPIRCSHSSPLEQSSAQSGQSGRQEPRLYAASDGDIVSAEYGLLLRAWRWDIIRVTERLEDHAPAVTCTMFKRFERKMASVAAAPHKRRLGSSHERSDIAGAEGFHSLERQHVRHRLCEVLTPFRRGIASEPGRFRAEP
jgi:hypothetical protein